MKRRFFFPDNQSKHSLQDPSVDEQNVSIEDELKQPPQSSVENPIVEEKTSIASDLSKHTPQNLSVTETNVCLNNQSNHPPQNPSEEANKIVSNSHTKHPSQSPSVEEKHFFRRTKTWRASAK